MKCLKVNYVNISLTFRSMLAKETHGGGIDLAFFSELHSVCLAKPRSRGGLTDEGKGIRGGEKGRTLHSLDDPTVIQMRRKSGDCGNPPLFPPLTTS